MASILHPTDLSWLPDVSGPHEAVSDLDKKSDKDAWAVLVESAKKRADFLGITRLDRVLRKRFGGVPPSDLSTKPLRLAVLGSSTIDHLLPSIRIGALRWNLWVDCYIAGYGQYHQELLAKTSPLAQFKPDTILFSLDARHVLSWADGPDLIVEKLRALWMLAREAFGCHVIQQTLIPIFEPLMGSNDYRLPFSPHHKISAVNHKLRDIADKNAVDLLSLDDRVAMDGLANWYNPTLWHAAKQEIYPAAAPLFGDLVARILAAQNGRSFKCLVLDLDNTLWGGLIGDDGLEGLALGAGSPLGEAFADFQRYILSLAQRGVILAVCSKNDETNALEPFDRHPEMLLKRDDIACFMANWEDKPSNLRRIADQLNIGIDSLVFVDDNAFERDLVRRALPMVAVPEMPEDVALYARCLADAGYFEALRVTEEDLSRTRQYGLNQKRDNFRSSFTDLASYLCNLGMELRWKPFDPLDVQRLAQLTNKTNQFNLTTRRYNEHELLSMAENPNCITLQLRLTDRFGDNGIIAVLISNKRKDEMFIDTWLMSCRVLGRGVEEATLNILARQAHALGAKRLIGEYRPTKRNGLVSEHYSKLGFTKIANNNKADLWELPIANYAARDTFIDIQKG